MTITIDGKIYSQRGEKKPHKNKNGYLYVTFYDKGKYKKYLVHRLVGEKFIPNPNNFDTINHKNGIKTDNRIENLEWMSRRDNLEHSRLNGLSQEKSQGIKNISFQDYLEIFELRKNKFSYRKIAERFNRSYKTIYEICNGITYKDFHKKLTLNK